MQDTMFVGLDVHKATISIAVASATRGGEVRHWGSVPNRADQVRKLVEKLETKAGQLHFCYEAGPCGYGLHRQLTELGHACEVVAPSLIPVKSGDRVKTDRRDAAMLAKLHRAGELTAVWVPDEGHEAMRDLVRARATAVRVVGKARQHLQGFLLRHGRVYPGKKGWTVAYRRWLTTIRFDHPAQQIVFQDYVHAVTDAEARVERLSAAQAAEKSIAGRPRHEREVSAAQAAEKTRWHALALEHVVSAAQAAEKLHHRRADRGGLVSAAQAAEKYRSQAKARAFAVSAAQAAEKLRMRDWPAP